MSLKLHNIIDMQTSEIEVMRKLRVVGARNPVHQLTE